MEFENVQLMSTVLTKLGDLPPLDVNKQRITDIVLKDIDDIDIDELVAAIELSPSLMTKIIGLANSAFYGSVVSISSVEIAIIRVLGLKMVKNITLGFSLAEAFDTKACSLFDEHHYWQMALLTASLNRKLCRSTAQEMNGDIAYLVGLLFSIGQLALAQIIPTDYSRVLMLIDEYDEKFAIEKSELGMHSGTVGALLGQKWSLPEEVQVVMTQNMNTSYDGDHWKYSLLTGLSSRWVERYIGGMRDDYEVDTEILDLLDISSVDFDTAAEESYALAEEAGQVASLFAA